jgi:hypothetical protein
MGNRKSDKVEKVKKGKDTLFFPWRGKPQFCCLFYFFNVKEDYSLDS